MKKNLLILTYAFFVCTFVTSVWAMPTIGTQKVVLKSKISLDKPLFFNSTLTTTKSPYSNSDAWSGRVQGSVIFFDKNNKPYWYKSGFQQISFKSAGQSKTFSFEIQMPKSLPKGSYNVRVGGIYEEYVNGKYLGYAALGQLETTFAVK